MMSVGYSEISRLHNNLLQILYIAKYINAAYILRKNNFEKKNHFDVAVFK